MRLWDWRRKGFYHLIVFNTEPCWICVSLSEYSAHVYTVFFLRILSTVLVYIYIYKHNTRYIHIYIYNIKHVVDKMIYLCQTRASLYLNIPCPWPLSRLQQRIISAKYWPRCTAAKCELYRAFEGPEAPLNVATPSTPKRPGSVHPLPTWKRWSSLARCDFL